MERPPKGDDLGALLDAHPLTKPLTEEIRRRLVRVAEVVDLEPGDTLVTRGDPGDAAFLVVSGRLIASVEGVEMGVVGRGETVGEMALLTGETRSATLTARRPSKVIRIGADDFATVLAAHPEAYRGLTAQLVERLKNTLSGKPTWVGHATVVGLSAYDPELALTAAKNLADALTIEGSRAIAVRSDSKPNIPSLEADHDVVIVVSTVDRLTGEPHSFDRVFLVVHANDSIPGLAPGSVSDLVLLHPAPVELPRGTKRWLEAIAPATHHHVRVGSTKDWAHVARRVLHCERVLVLSGGGARGLAHLGTYRALVEANIGIDAVVGVSAGAVFGTCIGLDWSPSEAVERTGEMLIEGERLVDFTIPMVALSSGRRLTDVIRNGFGADVELEDLWRPMVCLSADLTSLTVRVHRRGLLWRAVRASVAVPGVFPPLLEGEAVLVDGGVVDNLPVARARDLYPGATIISSDVGRRHELMTVDLPTDGVVGGWQTTWNRVGHRKQTPTLVSLLYRLTALGGGATSSEEGDVHIAHELDGIGMFDFVGGRRSILQGYELTKKVLADHHLTPDGDQPEFDGTQPG